MSKRTAKNSVFLDLFQNKSYLLKLYKTLHPEDTTATEDSAKSAAEYLSEHINSLDNKPAAELCEKMKSFKEYQMSMDTTDITDEMWSKGERHLMKLLETQPMPDGSLQKRVQITDILLCEVKNIVVEC